MLLLEFSVFMNLLKNRKIYGVKGQKVSSLQRAIEIPSISIKTLAKED